LLLAGRTGTVLIAVGLALLLVSLIPPAKTSSSKSGGSYMASESFQPLRPKITPLAPFANYTFLNRPFFTTLTPQQEWEIELTCNGTVNIYFIKTDQNSFLANFENGRGVSSLEDYLQTHPEMVGLQNEIDSKGKVSYIPTEVVNVTVILSNPSQNTISIARQADSTYSRIGPSQKALTVASFLIPIGFGLALPLSLTQRKVKAARS
jgi:hypothetical protein